MAREDQRWISYAALSEAAATDAAECATNRAFPARAFQRLCMLGALRNPPISLTEAPKLLHLLAAIGRGNLSVGRIFEGHCNALLLIERFGTPEQRATLQQHLSEGAIFGVWNTDVPTAPVMLSKRRLSGKKSFASGVDGLSYAIVTAAVDDRRQMLILSTANLAVDRQWWKPLGMEASGSHVVGFDGVSVTDAMLLGAPDDYTVEPLFSAGAIRFLAVQVGAMQAILDVAGEHLRATKRADNPYQLHRIGHMAVAVCTGYHWLDYVGRLWSRLDKVPATQLVIAANGARVAIERGALDVLEHAERGVGAGGMISPHPLERWIRDLRTYLRQPNPDAALTSVGAAFFDHTLRAGCDAEI